MPKSTKLFNYADHSKRKAVNKMTFPKLATKESIKTDDVLKTTKTIAGVALLVATAKLVR
jgi:hypothetical protein